MKKRNLTGGSAIMLAMLIGGAAIADEMEQVKKSLLVAIAPGKSAGSPLYSEAETRIGAWLVKNGWAVKGKQQEVKADASGTGPADGFDRVLMEAHPPGIQVLVELATPSGEGQGVALAVSIRAVATATSAKVAQVEKVSAARPNAAEQHLRALEDALGQALPELGRQLDQYARRVHEEGYRLFVNITGVPPEIATQILPQLKKVCSSARLETQAGSKKAVFHRYEVACRIADEKLASALLEALKGLSTEKSPHLVLATRQLVIIEYR